MLKEAYERGFDAALEKIGVNLGGAGQSAGANAGSAFKVRMTKSVSKPAGLAAKNTSASLSKKRMGPSMTTLKGL